MAKEVKYTLTVDAKTGIVNLGNFERNVGNVTKSLSHQSKAARETAASITSLVSGLKLLGGAVAAYGLSNIATSFLDAARVTENYNVRLQVLLGSVEKGNQLFKEMEGYASRTPFEFEEIMGAATQLSGIMGGSVETIKQWMPLIGDLAAASGLSIQDTTMQIVRMYSAGAASADLFRERGILAMLGFQAGVSYSAEETRVKLMEEWNKAGSQFKGATDKLAGTWDGTMSMIGDKWFKLRNDIMSAGVYDALKEELSAIDQEFESWLKNNEALIKQKVPEYIDSVKSSVEKLVSIYQMLPDGVVGAAGTGILGRILTGSTPLGVAVGAISLLNSQMSQLGFGLDRIVRDYQEYKKNASNIYGVLSGQLDWNTGERTPQNVYRGKINWPTNVPKPPVESPLVSSMGSGATPAKGQTSEELQAELEQRQAFFNSLNEATDIYNQGLLEKEQLATEARLELQRVETEQRMQFFSDINEAHAIVTQEEMAREKQKSELQKNTGVQALHNVQWALKEAGKSSKTAFKAFQLLSSAEAAVNTYKAAIGAYNAMASIPVVGPALGVAAAAAATAFGMAQVSSIMSMSPDGGSVSGAGAIGTYAVNPITEVPDLSSPTTAQQPQTVINLNGDMLADDYYIERLAEKINEASEDRNVRIVVTHAQTAGSIA